MAKILRGLGMAYLAIALLIASTAFVSRLTHHYLGPEQYVVIQGQQVPVETSIGPMTLISCAIRGALWPVMSSPVWSGDYALVQWLIWPWLGEPNPQDAILE